MMRRIAIACAVAGGLVVASTLLVAANVERLVARHREAIVAGIAEGFGRPVRVERIGVALHGGVAIEIDGLHVADDPAFGGGDFVAAERTYAVLRLGALVRGELDVRRIAVHAPVVTIVRSPDGMNVDSLGRSATRSGRATPAVPAAAAPPPTAAARPSAPPEPLRRREPDTAAAIPAVAIALLELEDGLVRYVDRTKPSPVETTITPLDVRITDLSLAGAMRVELDAQSDGAVPATLRMRGTVGPVGDPPFAADVPVEQHVTVHAAAIDVEDLTVTGRLRRDDRGAPVATLRLIAPAARAGGADLEAIDVAASDRDGVTTLERLTFRALGGSVEATGRVEHRATPATYAIDAHVHDVDVARAVGEPAPDVAARYEGRLDADWTAAGSAGDEATVRRTLTANGRAVVRDGRLRGVNVADAVLSGVTGVGGLVTLVPSRVRERYRETLTGDDTQFDEVSADVRIAGERAVLKSLVVAARDYAVRGAGTIGFDRQIDVAATLVASPRLTADVVGALDDAKLLTDAEGRLAIPFHLTGVLPDVRARPDADFVARVLEKVLSGHGLERLLRGRRDGPRRDGKRHDTGDAIRRELDRLLR